MATAIVPGIYDPALPTRTEFVTTEDAEDAVRRLAQQAGVFVGWSSGAAIVAAGRVLSARPSVHAFDPVVVVTAPASGTRYLSAGGPSAWRPTPPAEIAGARVSGARDDHGLLRGEARSRGKQQA